jgi:hypothetical protein
MRTVAIALLLLTGQVAAGEKAQKTEALKSGCEKGAGVDVFQTHAITGPNAGKTLCYI